MTLRQHAISGIRWTLVSAIGRAILQFMQIAILARLLTPVDFGLMALVVAILAFLQIFADAGVSNAIIHHQEIDDNQLSSLFWLNITVSAVLVILLAIVSEMVAEWYQEPDLKYLLLLAGAVLMIGAISQQLRIVAQKNLQFNVLAKIEIFSALFGFSLSILAAYAEFGVYSLIFGALGFAIISSTMSWIYIANGWRPLWRLQIKEIRSFVKFGVFMVGNNLANTLNSQIDVMLGLKLYGAQSIGFYSISKDINLKITSLINPIVTQVSIPIMAKTQEDDLLLMRIYLQIMRMTASINFPIYIFLFIFAPDVVYLLLGNEWDKSIPLIRIFSIWALIRSTGNPVGSLLLAKGRADLSFKWNMVWVLVMPITIWIGSHYEVMGIATSMVVMGVIGYWPNWYFLVKPLCGANFWDYSFQLVNPFILSSLAGTVALISTYYIEGPQFKILIGGGIGLIIYITLCIKYNKNFIKAFIEILPIKNFIQK